MEPVSHHQDCDCTCEDCMEDAYQVELDLEYERKYLHKRKKQKSPQQILQDRYNSGDPQVGLLGEPSGKFDYYVLYPKPTFDPIFPTPPPDDWGNKLPPPQPPKISPYYQKALTCLQQAQSFAPLPLPKILDYCMFTLGTSSYAEQFPPLEDFELPQQNTKHTWKIKTPAGKNLDGSQKRVSPAEAALNWQAENAVKQNAMLSKILDSQTKTHVAVTKQLTSLTELIQDCKAKIA